MARHRTNRRPESENDMNIHLERGVVCHRRSGASEHGGLVIAWRPSVSARLSKAVLFSFFFVILCYFLYSTWR